jgi:hypothetical protein
VFTFDTRLSSLLVPALAGLLLFLIPAVAHADQPKPGGRTTAVGVRVRGDGPVVVGELWLGLVGLSAEAGVGLGENEAPRSGFVSDNDPTTTNTDSSILLGAAAYYAVARGKQTQLSAGLRYRYQRAHLTRDDANATDKTVSTTSEVSVPIRIEVWPVKRVSLYIEFGLAVRFEKSVRTRDNRVPEETILRGKELRLFGDPLGNAGVSFYF